MLNQIKKTKVLIVSQGLNYPWRIVLRCFLDSYQKYLSNAICYYFILPQKEILQNNLRNLDYDLIIFDCMFSGLLRWGDYEDIRHYVDKVNFLKSRNTTKVLVTQDEWLRTDNVCNFINEFGINVVISVAPPSEWHTLYPTVDFSKVRFYQGLTGYLEDHIVVKTKNLIDKQRDRPIDIGYRAARSPAWFGRHGFLKTQVAEVFQEKSPSFGLKIDISTNRKNEISGFAWYKFMASCKYFIGVEGGVSVLDPIGKIWKEGVLFQKKFPNATFEEIENAVFPNQEGSVKLFALSPRHLEAVCTKTCQILVEGDYNGILKPNIHYIPLKKDFSDIETVLQKTSDVKLRQTIAENAYKDIVLSGKYTYKGFISFLLEKVFENEEIPLSKITLKEKITYQLNRLFFWWYNSSKMLNYKVYAFFVKPFIDYSDGMGWKYGVEKAIVVILTRVGARKLKSIIYKKNKI